MVPNPPPNPWLGINNCHEAKKNETNYLGVFFVVC